MIEPVFSETEHAPLARRELILGGQKSGKSRRAETLAAAWLAQDPPHQAVLLATAQAHDSEMQERIAQHQHDRAQRVPQLQTLDVAQADLGQMLLQPVEQGGSDGPDCLAVLDCLTLWLTQWLMPMDGAVCEDKALEQQLDRLLTAVRRRRGPLIIVSNEIGLGVIPMGPEVRRFVDTLGQLHQALAARCDRVTLMVAGLPLQIKAEAP